MDEDADDDAEDDFVFAPGGWDIALAMGPQPNPEDRPALDELADAMIVSPGRLATDPCRRAARARLGRLAHYGRGSMPILAQELARIAHEPLPVDPNDDDIWEVVAHALLAEHT